MSNIALAGHLAYTEEPEILMTTINKFIKLTSNVVGSASLSITQFKKYLVKKSHLKTDTINTTLTGARLKIQISVNSQWNQFNFDLKKGKSSM